MPGTVREGGTCREHPLTHHFGDGPGGTLLWGRYERKASQPDNEQRVTENGTAPTIPSLNGPLVVPASEEWEPAASGSDAVRASFLGRYAVHAVSDKRSPAGIGSDAGGALRAVIAYCGVSEGAQSGARSSKAV